MNSLADSRILKSITSKLLRNLKDPLVDLEQCISELETMNRSIENIRSIRRATEAQHEVIKLLESTTNKMRSMYEELPEHPALEEELNHKRCELIELFRQLYFD